MRGTAIEWTAVLVCVGVFLVFNAMAVCVFWAACVVMDEAENEFNESEGEGRG